MIRVGLVARVTIASAGLLTDTVEAQTATVGEAVAIVVHPEVATTN